MSLSHFNPHIRYALIHNTIPVRHSASVCYDCRLFYIRQGTGSILANGTEYTFSNNTAIFLPPQTHYHLAPSTPDEEFSMMVFNFDLVDDYSYLEESLGTVPEHNFIPEKSPVYPIPPEFSQIIIQTNPSLYEPLKKCTVEFLKQSAYYRESISATLKSCMIELLRSHKNQPLSKICADVMDYIQNHYHIASLTNEQIASHFGYHPYYLSQLLKQATGKTLHNYLLSYRLRIATSLLLTTHWDINTVCWKCGFNSCAYFIRQFKQCYGTTPKQYRKANHDLLF